MTAAVSTDKDAPAKVRKLHFYYPDNLPAVLGCDGAGTVEARMFDQGKLKIEVSKVLPLKDAAAAHKLVDDGHTMGKVVLQID